MEQEINEEPLFDSLDETSDLYLFSKMRTIYWVLATDSTQSDLGWLYSLSKPSDVSDGRYYWRRPTFEEFVMWKRWWDRHRVPHDQTLARTQFRRNQKDFSVCECGHDEESHDLNEANCLDGCGCHVFIEQVKDLV